MKNRDKRRRTKERRDRRAVPSQTPNPAGMTVLPKATGPVNGKYCRVRSTRIDLSVCTVQSERTPELCRGCA